MALYGSAVLIALGNGLTTPTLPAYVSRRTGVDTQGLTLGTLQSASALARVLGPALGGLLYEFVAVSAPYYAGAVGFLLAAVIAFVRLK